MHTSARGRKSFSRRHHTSYLRLQRLIFGDSDEFSPLRVRPSIGLRVESPCRKGERDERIPDYFSIEEDRTDDK